MSIGHLYYLFASDTSSRPVEAMAIDAPSRHVLRQLGCFEVADEVHRVPPRVFTCDFPHLMLGRLLWRGNAAHFEVLRGKNEDRQLQDRGRLHKHTASSRPYLAAATRIERLRPLRSESAQMTTRLVRHAERATRGL